MKRAANPWNKSLIARLTGTFFVITLMAVIPASGLTYLRVRQSLIQSVFDRLGAVAVLKEDSLNRWLDQQRVSIVFITSIPEVRRQSGVLFTLPSTSLEWQPAYNILTEYLKSVVTGVSDFDEIFILDLDGNIVLSTVKGDEGKNQAETEYYQEGRSNTFIQPVYAMPDTGKPTITVSTPLFDDNNRRVGILAGHLNLTRLDRIILDRTGLGVSGETYLITPSNEFVSATLFENPNTLNRGEVRSEGVEKALNGETGSGLYANYQGVPVIGIYTWLEDEGAALIAELSQAEAFAPARQLAWTIFEIGLLASVVLAGGVFLVARRIARPILAISDTAARVASGDLNQTAPVLTDDEVGTLAQSFNEMTGQLRVLYEGLELKVAERTIELREANTQLEEEIRERERVEMQLRNQNEYLAALHDTSLGLIGRLDLNELFEDLVVRAGQLLQTPNGYIYIVEPETNSIVCRVGVGIFSQLVGFRLKMGEGVAGTIWKSGEALTVDDYDDWPGRAKTIELNMIRSIIGIPLKNDSQVVGIIGLAYERTMDPGKKFGSAEIELLERFAHLASIALDNARLYTSAQEARAVAEDANESKSVFLASVSHELRTPLTSILGFTRIVQKRLQERIFPLLIPGDAKLERVEAQIDENLQIILSEGERLTSLINDLLDLEKIRAGKMTWNMQPLKVVDIVNHAASATASLFEAKGLNWEQVIPIDLPEITGDHNRLVQVIINLISNAVKFTQEGTISCLVRLENDELVLSVTDQGIGIAEQDQPRVFEMFSQVGDTLTNKPKGTGLGLPISKRIVEHHGGRIWVESQPQKGSSFFVSLPIRDEKEQPAAQLPEPFIMQPLDLQTLVMKLKPRIAAIPDGNTGREKRILVVDDDPNIRKLLRMELESEHYRVFEASNGREALERVKQDRPDLVILDVVMPGMDGYDVAAQLKQDPETMHLPIVIISIHQDQERGVQVGIDRYLVKPVNIPELLDEVDALLERGSEQKMVLVVDEDPSTIQILREALAAQNYQVVTAQTGEEGLEKALTSKPDLVIVNSLISEKHNLIQVLRVEKQLEHISFLLFHSNHSWS